MAQTLKQKGNELFSAKSYEEAAAMYSKAIEAVPDDAVFYNNRAACYANMVRIGLSRVFVETKQRSELATIRAST